VTWHLALITTKGLAPKTTVTEELELGNLGALRRKGSESFFPRQVYRDLIACTLGFAALVTISTYYPWELGEPANKYVTPAGIKPEWYFLPPYQFLKYFDDNLYAALPFLESWGVQPDFLGVLTIQLIAAVLFLLPVLDRGKERRITRRPFFALFAFALLVGVVGMGVVGWLSESEREIFGTRYRFDNRGVPTRIEAPPAIDENATAPGKTAATGATGGERLREGGGGAEPQQDRDPPQAPPLPDTLTPETPAPETPAPETPAPETPAQETPAQETPAPETPAPATPEEPAADPPASDPPAPLEPEPAVVETFRDDGLAPGGVCAGCHPTHESAARKWRASVHFAAEIQCRDCHGGNDTLPPQQLLAALEALIASEDSEWPRRVDEPEQKRLYLWAHLGMSVDESGDPAAPDDDAVVAFCGACHARERDHWTAAAPAHSNHCVDCHSNHEVLEPGDFLYDEKGYTGDADPLTVRFRAVRAVFRDVDARLAEARASLDALRGEGYPVAGAVEEEQRLALLVAKADSELRPLIHRLDADAAADKARALLEPLAELHAALDERLRARDERWVFVAGVWGFALVFVALFTWRLRRMGPPRPLEGGWTAGDVAGVVRPSSSDDDRSALLEPLDGERTEGSRTDKDEPRAR